MKKSKAEKIYCSIKIYHVVNFNMTW